jgi:hypothetical protein
MAININSKPYVVGVGAPPEPKAAKQPPGTSTKPPQPNTNGSGGVNLDGAVNLLNIVDSGSADKLRQGSKYVNDLGSNALKPEDKIAPAVGLLNMVDSEGVGKYARILMDGKGLVDKMKNGSVTGDKALASGMNLVANVGPGGMGQIADVVSRGIALKEGVANGSFSGDKATLSAIGLASQFDPNLVKTVHFTEQGLSLAKDIQSGALRGTDAAAPSLGLLGSAIGGEVGQTLGLGGKIAQNFSDIAKSTVPGAAGGNIVGLGLDLAQLVGVKIDPGVSSLAGLGASLLAGPAGFLGAGIQLFTSLLSMGDHNKTVDLQKGINATGRMLDADEDGEDDESPSDTSSIFDHTNTGFLSIGSSHSSSMQYETTGGTIDPRLLKDVEFKIEDRPNTRSGMFGTRNENAGKKQLTIKANYDGINPATGGTSGETKIDLSPEQVQAYKTALGGESGKIDPKDLQKMAVVQPQLNDMKISFKQNENDPTLYNYKDVNGDGIPDRIGISLNTEGLEKKGDGSVSVTILDKDRHAVGDTLTANGSSKIEDNLKEVGEMQQLRPLLETYSASHIETWDGGKDLTSTYRALKANGGLEKLKQVGPAMAEYMQARQTPGADVRQPLEKLNGLSKELGLGFNARAYAAANPDLIKNIGTDPSLLAEHYRNHGNFEGRALNLSGDKAPQWVPPALRNTTVLGSEISSEPNKNAEITRGQSLVSNNGKFMATMQADGNFCVYDISGKDKKLVWDAKSNEQHSSGFLGIGGSTKAAATSFVMQADGNLVGYDADHKGRFYSETGTTGVNRAVKLALSDDGNLVVKDSQGGKDLWSSGGGPTQRAASNDGSAPAYTVPAPRPPVTYGAEPLRPA